MAISISSRIRYAMVALSIGLCLLFSALIFLLVYVIEDQVFVNQIKAEKSQYERSRDPNWQPRNRYMQRISSAEELPTVLPRALLTTILEKPGVHEHFDADIAMFIAHFAETSSDKSYFIVYDVRELLAVRDSKTSLFVIIGLLTLLLSAAAILLAHQLTKKTLAPVRRLTHQLQSSDVDDNAIKLAQEFAGDEIGVLAHELAQALDRAQQSAQREYQFNRGVSHELRSPIQAAQSATELLKLQTADADEALQRPVQRLQRSIAEMNQIVDAFLWIASNRKVGPDDGCSVKRVTGLVSDHQKRHPAINWQVSSTVADDFTYPLPETVLLVILASLINNSIKHGDGHLILLGIEESCIHVENGASKGYSASFGIGLSIARRLCQHFACELITDDQWQDNLNGFRVTIVMPNK